jgi:subtilase family serine protease
MSLLLANTGHHRWKASALAAVAAAAWLAMTGTAAAFEKAAVGAAAAADQAVQFNIYLPLRDRDGAEALLTQLQTPGSASYHQWLTPAQFDQRFGPQASTVDAITRELSAHGFAVTEVHTHSLRVSGTAGAVKSAFGAALAKAQFASGKEVLVAATPLNLTPQLAAAGAIVADFSGKIRMQKPTNHTNVTQPENRYSNAGGYWFDDLKQAYSYPSYKVLTGQGVTIGILMQGGFQQSDMNLYFGHELLSSPNISEVDIDGGTPFDPNGSFETHLDIQQSGGMAPNANIILYNLASLEDATILDGLTTIIEDNVADVVNMSFSGPEAQYLPAYNGGTDFTGILGIYDDFFMEGNSLGITFVSSSGDWGAKDIPAPACFDATPPNPCGPMLVGVGSPASSPHVTGVGGTNLITTYNALNPADLNSAYVGENADFDALDQDIFYGTTATGAVWGSGGGISLYYKKPSYQNFVSGMNLPRSAERWRTTPDVSLQMGGCPFGTVYYDENGVCPPDRSYVLEVIGGELEGVIGTSCSSPEFVGLMALKIQLDGGRLGNENYDVYFKAAAQEFGFGSPVFHDEIPGNNGYYSTGRGYNLVLGNGTVRGADFIGGPRLPVAGVPQTPSNP